MKTYLLMILSNILIFFSQSILSNDLVYRPQNSAFGGSPAATQVLLSKASAQNLTTDPNKKDRQPAFLGAETSDEINDCRSHKNEIRD